MTFDHYQAIPADMDQAIQQQFTDMFGEPPIVVAHSLSRVNLIGEHTDYNEGWVVPAALN